MRVTAALALSASLLVVAPAGGLHTHGDVLLSPDACPVCQVERDPDMPVASGARGADAAGRLLAPALPDAGLPPSHLLAGSHRSRAPPSSISP